MDPEKMRAIKEWKTPKDVLELIFLMGLRMYYGRFIEGFSKLSHPNSSLQKKGVKFEWNSNSQESFQRPKEMLTSAPVLKIVYLDESFVVCINTCKHGIGGVLTQNGHVITYESRKMK